MNVQVFTVHTIYIYRPPPMTYVLPFFQSVPCWLVFKNIQNGLIWKFTFAVKLSKNAGKISKKQKNCMFKKRTVTHCCILPLQSNWAKMQVKWKNHKKLHVQKKHVCSLLQLDVHSPYLRNLVYQMFENPCNLQSNLKILVIEGRKGCWQIYVSKFCLLPFPLMKLLQSLPLQHWRCLPKMYLNTVTFDQKYT